MTIKEAFETPLSERHQTISKELLEKTLHNAQIRIEWDDSNLREIEEAKSLYRQARAEGRKLTLHDGTLIECFRAHYQCFLIKETELKENEWATRIHDETGDRRLIWDAQDPKQVKEASKLFQEYLDKGWKAYTVDEKSGKVRGKRIYGFNPNTLEIFFDDKSPTDKLKAFAEKTTEQLKEKIIDKKEALNNFVKAMKSVKIIPRTYPG